MRSAVCILNKLCTEDCAVSGMTHALNNNALEQGFKGGFLGLGEMAQWLKHLTHKSTGIWISRMYVNKCGVVMDTSL